MKEGKPQLVNFLEFGDLMSSPVSAVMTLRLPTNHLSFLDLSGLSCPIGDWSQMVFTACLT